MTELMLRLIKDGKIVGYERHKFGEVLHGIDVGEMVVDGEVLDSRAYNLIQNFFIKHDSFDLGIKVGNEWWFEGDIILDSVYPEFNEQHVLCYGIGYVDGGAQVSSGWFCKPLNFDCDENTLFDPNNWDRIGTVYDKGDQDD